MECLTQSGEEPLDYLLLKRSLAPSFSSSEMELSFGCTPETDESEECRSKLSMERSEGLIRSRLGVLIALFSASIFLSDLKTVLDC